MECLPEVHIYRRKRTRWLEVILGVFVAFSLKLVPYGIVWLRDLKCGEKKRQFLGLTILVKKALRHNDPKASKCRGQKVKDS